MSSRVIRIVDIDDNTTEKSLEQFLLIFLSGTIKNIFIGRDDILQINFAYAVFQFDQDAKLVADMLNGSEYNNRVLKIELIGPDLPYTFYGNHNEVQPTKINLIPPKKKYIPRITPVVPTTALHHQDYVSSEDATSTSRSTTVSSNLIPIKKPVSLLHMYQYNTPLSTTQKTYSRFERMNSGCSKLVSQPIKNISQSPLTTSRTVPRRSPKFVISPNHSLNANMVITSRNSTTSINSSSNMSSQPTGHNSQSPSTTSGTLPGTFPKPIRSLEHFVNTNTVVTSINAITCENSSSKVTSQPTGHNSPSSSTTLGILPSSNANVRQIVQSQVLYPVEHRPISISLKKNKNEKKCVIS